MIEFWQTWQIVLAAHNLPLEAQQVFDSTTANLVAMGKVPVAVDLLFRAFESGTRRFVGDTRAQAVLQNRVRHHCERVFGTWIC